MKELMAMNERGEYPVNLKDFMQIEEPDEVDEVYSNVVGQDSVTRFDDERKRNRKKRSGRRNQGKNGPKGKPKPQQAGEKKGPQSDAKSGGDSSKRNKRRPKRRGPKAPNSDAAK